MDQAFNNNEKYLAKFREDLRNQRFALIITEPIYPRLGAEKKNTSAFVEENDTWVINVSRPILCYYKKIATYANVRVEILSPIENPIPCEADPDNR
jgi:hypothetical protein